MTIANTGPPPLGQAAGLAAALRGAFTDQARRGVLVAMGVRALWVALVLAETLLAFIPSQHGRPQFFQFPPAAYYVSVAFSAVSLVLYLAAARSRRPMFWCFVTMVFDVLCVSQGQFFWLWSLPGTDWVPTFVNVRYQDVAVLLILLAIYALPLSQRLLYATGGVCAAMWALGLAYAFQRYPGGRLYLGPFGPGVSPVRLAAIMDPVTLLPDYVLIQLILVGVFTAVLAASTRAARRQLVAEVRAETAAAGLARFFPPKIAALLTRAGARPMVPARRRVAILFVGAPSVAGDGRAAFEALKAYYARVEAAIFAHDGVIDRFTGGPVMAVFGALDDDQDAAARALACARTLIAQGPIEGDAGGAERAPVALALHLGEAVCGEIGDGDSRAFCVVGDAVHVARRMLDEAAGRPSLLLVSDDAAAWLAASGAPATDLVAAGSFLPRGREARVTLWAIAR